jgi:hypothetical protein
MRAGPEKIRTAKQAYARANRRPPDPFVRTSARRRMLQIQPRRGRMVKKSQKSSSALDKILKKQRRRTISNENLCLYHLRVRL